MPELIEEKEEAEGGSKGISVWKAGEAEAGDGGPYGDMDSKQFYEDLQDLTEMVPLTALGIRISISSALAQY